MAGDLERWDPLPRDEAVSLFLRPSLERTRALQWSVCGGHALELHLGHSWRDHDDLDIGVWRADVARLPEVLDGWDVHVAAAGALTPWDGRALSAEESENNLWFRRSPTEPWRLDVVIADGDADNWIYRRDPSIVVPWSDAILATTGGVPYLAPELQLLFKSARIRPKDQHDAEIVIPALEAERIERLGRWLPPDHDWQVLIGRRKAAQVLEDRQLGGNADVKLLATGRSSQAWACAADNRRWVVRVVKPNSGRRQSYRSEAAIGRLLAAKGHPVCPWTVTADGQASIGPALPGRPVEYEEQWSVSFAQGLGRLLRDLHRLPSRGFGPLENVGTGDAQVVPNATVLRGTSHSPEVGVIDRWFHAAVWPFDGSELSSHPLSRLAPLLVGQVGDLELELRSANAEPFGVVHSDLHRDHLLVDPRDGSFAGLLDFGDAFVGSTAWDFALLHWYYGVDNARKVADAYSAGGDGLYQRGRLLAVAVGCYKLAKNPDDSTVADRLESVCRDL